MRGCGFTIPIRKIGAVLTFAIVLSLFATNLHASSERESFIKEAVIQDSFSYNTDLWIVKGNPYIDIENGAAVLTGGDNSLLSEIWLKTDVRPPYTLEFRYCIRGTPGEDGIKLMLNREEIYSNENVCKIGFGGYPGIWHNGKFNVNNYGIEAFIDGKAVWVNLESIDYSPWEIGFQAATDRFNKCIIDDFKLTKREFVITDDTKRELSFPYQNIYVKRFFEAKVKLNGTAARIPVLMYHHILEPKDKKRENNLIVTTEEFERQMKYLSENDNTTITTDELMLYLEDKLILPKKSVLITFDDGYKSNYVYAYPILRKFPRINERHKHCKGVGGNSTNGKGLGR